MSKHSNIEKAYCLGLHNLRIKDIQILVDCGTTKAVAMAQELREWFKATYGYELRDKQVPTEEFIKYFHYPEKRVLRYADMERKNAAAVPEHTAQS